MKPLRALLLRILSGWDKLIGYEPDQYTPGFLGRIPHILFLRYFTVLGVLVRLLLHSTQYSPDKLSTRLWVITLMLLASEYATFITLKRNMKRTDLHQAGLIVMDVVLISLAYGLTNNPESEIFMFYYLPVFTAVEYLGLWAAMGVYGAVEAGHGLALHFMKLEPIVPWTTLGLALRVYAPRGVFLLVIGLTSAVVFHRLSRSQAELRGVLNSLHSVSAAAAPNAQALDQALDFIHSVLTDEWEFEFATISLVDEYRDCIETVRGRNVPPRLDQTSKTLPY
jgi:hypothetical protein